MVSVLASSAVDRGFEHRSVKPKDYKMCICCFSAKHAALRSKSKDWLAQNPNNVSECSDRSTNRLVSVSKRYKNRTKLLDIFISFKCNLFLPWYTVAEKLLI